MKRPRGAALAPPWEQHGVITLLDFRSINVSQRSLSNTHPSPITNVTEYFLANYLLVCKVPTYRILWEMLNQLCVCVCTHSWILHMANLWKVTGNNIHSRTVTPVTPEGKHYTNVRKSCHSFTSQGQRSLHVKTLLPSSFWYI